MLHVRRSQPCLWILPVESMQNACAVMGWTTRRLGRFPKMMFLLRSKLQSLQFKTFHRSRSHHSYQFDGSMNLLESHKMSHFEVHLWEKGKYDTGCRVLLRGNISFSANDCNNLNSFVRYDSSIRLFFIHKIIIEEKRWMKEELRNGGGRVLHPCVRFTMCS